MPGPSRITRAALLAVAALLPAAAVEAQPQRSGPHVIVRDVHDRWVHEGQLPATVPFQSSSSAMPLRVTITNAPPTYRLLHLGDGQWLALDLRNRILLAEVPQPAMNVVSGQAELATRQRRWMRLTGPGATLALPMARLWELPFPVGAAPLAPGVVWADTLAFDADGEGLRERLEGVWTHHVVGDTVVAGRRLPLVVTDADVRYTATELSQDAATESAIEVLRDVAGRMHSRAAVDTALGVRAAGRDSTLLRGTATLRMAGSEPVVSGVRYDRRRFWMLQDSVTWAAQQDSVREARRPPDADSDRAVLEQRLRDGDTAAIDSLLAAWSASGDPDERRSIELTLRMYARTAPGTASAEQQLLDVRLAAGDTAGYVAGSLAPMGRPAFTLDLIPWLREPRHLWRMGILPRFVYEELGTAMLASTPLLEPDTTRWRCRPDVCDAIIALLDAPVELRLRDAALAGAFARDPARWFDRVQQRAAEGSAIARRAERLGLGVGATWPAARGVAMPEPGAGWRQWLEWMGGSLRFESSHRNALRIYTARTGRNPLAELVQQWPAARDSARLVLGTVLWGTGSIPDPAPADVATSLIAGSPIERDAAARQLPRLMREHATPADPGAAAALVDALLVAVASDGRLPWRRLDGSASTSARLPAGGDGPVYLLQENLPPAVTVPAGWTLAQRDAVETRSSRAAGAVVEVMTVRTWGDFVTVGVQWTTFQPHTAGAPPFHHGAGDSFILLRTAAGWVVVTGTSWTS